MMIMDKWHGETNYLRDPVALWQRENFKDMLCLEHRTMDDWATILMGTLFLVLVLTKLRHYAEDECGNVRKGSRMLPDGRLWQAMGILANSWCLLSTLILMPPMFWSMQSAVTVLTCSLGVLFIFALDDFDGLSGSILGVDDSGFQRALCWHVALLSQCPVTLRDLINPEATTAEELWRIELDQTGLLAVDPPSAEPSKVRRYAETRLAPLEPGAGLRSGESDETTPLTAARKSPPRRSLLKCISAQEGKIRYITWATRPFQVLPGDGSSLREGFWYLLVWLCRVFQLLLPPLWFLINRPCPHPIATTSMMPASRDLAAELR
jgi:hypothetical protein